MLVITSIIVVSFPGLFISFINERNIPTVDSFSVIPFKNSTMILYLPLSYSVLVFHSTFNLLFFFSIGRPYIIFLKGTWNAFN